MTTTTTTTATAYATATATPTPTATTPLMKDLFALKVMIKIQGSLRSSFPLLLRLLHYVYELRA